MFAGNKHSMKRVNVSKFKSKKGTIRFFVA